MSQEGRLNIGPQLQPQRRRGRVPPSAAELAGWFEAIRMAEVGVLQMFADLEREAYSSGGAAEVHVSGSAAMTEVEQLANESFPREDSGTLSPQGRQRQKLLAVGDRIRSAMGSVASALEILERAQPREVAEDEQLPLPSAPKSRSIGMRWTEREIYEAGARLRTRRGGEEWPGIVRTCACWSGAPVHH